jgi:hypothetical protein
VATISSIIRAYSVPNLPTVNSNPIGENSPNLFTLAPSQEYTTTTTTE